MKKVRILHITKDDKFFDSLFDEYEADERLENKAIVDVANVENYQFTRIRHTDKVVLLDKKGVRDYLRRGEYDVVFFYPLSFERYRYIFSIPKDKIIIWWTWGSDIYHSYGGMKPLIDLQIHKPLTIKLLQELKADSHSKKKAFLKRIVKYPCLFFRKKALSRINYFQPVLPFEYKEVCKHDFFRAKEYYFPGSFLRNHQDSKANLKPASGNVLFGHSQSPDDNHLDAWDDVKKFIPAGRRVVIPINYIGNETYADAISKLITSDTHELVFLRSFMSPQEYFNLVDGCSYAVYGLLRQQAIGNIYYCLKTGIKLFLYKDSIVYKFLLENGYVVYAIEDIDEHSFNTPLREKEMEQNNQALLREKAYRDRIGNAALDGIINIVNA